MNRRTFIGSSLFGSTSYLMRSRSRTQHLVLIGLGGGVRKREYYEDSSLSPNLKRLAREAFVFEQDHCERIASHEAAFAELLQGRTVIAASANYPTLLDYVGNGYAVDAIERTPDILQRYKPRIVVCNTMAHDIGHESYEGYLQTVRNTDLAIGRVFDWVKEHAYFSRNTAIVVRPVFGRDDEVNEHGSLHHSYGFYYTHRVASIFWGPDFNRGVDKRTVINSCDLTPTLAALFNVRATYAEGRIVPGLFKRTVVSSGAIAPV
jgi:hypothetical protein